MIKFRDIDKIKFIVKEATDLDIMYAYDDLVFPEHGAFIIRFDNQSAAKVFCHFHKDCIYTEKERLFASLSSLAKRNDLEIEPGATYSLSEKNDHEVEIKFMEL